MILITGGAYQGKLAFAQSICEKTKPVIAEAENVALEELKQADIVAHFHLYIKKLLQEKQEPKPWVLELLQENPNVILELTQLGCGVVPIEPFDRKYREEVGKISCMLAKLAEQVWMVNAGIGMRLK
ncbi:MAG: bifunctional adenosylcobinamide kinase/adenosylcobinamide-phosphate guanylyltransferase [Lachnospiraceae bacterium]